MNIYRALVLCTRHILSSLPILILKPHYELGTILFLFLQMRYLKHKISNLLQIIHRGNGSIKILKRRSGCRSSALKHNNRTASQLSWDITQWIGAPGNSRNSFHDAITKKIRASAWVGYTQKAP